MSRISKSPGFVISLLLSAAALSGCTTVRAAAAVIDFEPGGSNYVVYSVGRYLAEPSEATWYAPGNMRPVIGTYDQDPGTVERQLRAMWANGQRKVALVLFYGDFTPDLRIRDSAVYGLIVNAKAGRLMPTHEANLVQVLRLVQSIGYDEVVFRFATTGVSDPRGWSSWDESTYQTNLAFIVNTKAVIDAELREGAPKVLYDLDVELAGLREGQARSYAVRLWRDFTNRFGADRSMGFSFAFERGRITAALSAFDEVGIRPPQDRSGSLRRRLQGLCGCEVRVVGGTRVSQADCDPGGVLQRRGRRSRCETSARTAAVEHSHLVSVAARPFGQAASFLHGLSARVCQLLEDIASVEDDPST